MTPSPDSRRAGSRLGPYEIVARLGTGGMGEVYRARDTRLERPVALKLLSEEFVLDRNRLRRFEQEARVVSGLNHPNIVTVFEIGEASSQPYIAMELVEGQTLRQALRPGGLPFRKLLDIAGQMAEGLARAHEADVVHRDLKPENVMVTPDGVVKILDFGLAKLTRSPIERGAGPDDGTLPLPTQPGVLLGTVRYMSPEQASGSAADFRADQFAFGSLLYEMATGVPAFQKATTVDTLSAILHDEPEPLARVNPKLPAPLRWIIERCLAKDPKDRYAATRDLAHDLASLRLHMSEVSLAGTDPAPKVVRRGWPALLIGLAAVTSLIAIGLLLGRSAGKPTPLTFRQLTFRRGGIWSARFAPDGQTIVYGASWEGRPLELFTTRIGSTESRSLGFGRADILSVSASGELAILIGSSFGILLRPPHNDMTIRDPRLLFGTLARVPLAGGTPRELLEQVLWADWGPDGQSLAVIHSVGPRQRLEYPIGTVLYENEPWINRPRVSPDGKTVAFQDSADINVVQPPEKARSLGHDADELAWSPSGKELWYSRFDGAVTRLFALTLSGEERLVTLLPGDFVLHDVARDGRVLVSRTSETSEIFAFSAGEARPRNLSWLDRSDIAALSPDGKTLVFNEEGVGGGIYLRGTDGSPAKRLGDGSALDLSPDGKWVVTYVGGDEDGRCVLLPTGAGEPRTLASTKPEVCGSFFSGGSRLFAMNNAEGRGRQAWVRDVAGTSSRAVTPEQTYRGRISPDGRFVSALAADGRYHVYPVDGGASWELVGLLPGEEPLCWSADSRSLFVRGADATVTMESPLARVYRLDPRTGRRELFREIPSLDPAAGGGVGAIRVSDDEKTIVYTHYRFPSELFLIEGLR